MKTTIHGRQSKQYLVQLTHWAKRLGAEEMTVHSDHSVTLECKYGNICIGYKPSPKELNK